MKKCSKKTIVKIIIAACLLLGVIVGILFAVLWNRTMKINVIKSKDAYDWSYTKAFVGEKDADMNIDGKLTEERWKDKQWLTHTEKGVNMRYTTVFSEKGLYIAAVAEDKRMQWNDTRAFMNNSSFRFYVVSNAAKQFYCFDCMSFYVDEKDSSCRQQTRFESKAVRGTNKEGVPTLTAEFFATWKDLHYEVNPETGIPEFARVVPMYRYVESFESADNAFLKPIFAEVENDRVRNALLFNSNGYINIDQEGAELGNAGNGFAKSDGWDLSDLSGGEDGVKTVRTTVEHGQAIFFKNINSSRYSYSVDMKIKGGLNDPAPTAGVCDMKSASEFNCMRIAGNPYLDSGKKTITYYLLDFYETLWHDILYGERTEGKGSDVINIRVIKDNTRYYYIFNGVYEFSVDLDWLGGKTCPGLYSLGADVVFSNWQVTDYEGADNDKAFNELVDKYMYVVKVPEKISGGTLSLDKLAIRKGSNEAVNLTIRPAKGYMLTDILINGNSQYEKLIKQMKDGVVELHPTESLYIEAVFTPLPIESCIRITGKVLRNNGAANIGLPYKVTSRQQSLSNVLFFYDKTTTAGVFDILLLKAGNYVIGGRKVNTNGVYTLTFEGTFPKGEKNTYVIDTKESRYNGLSHCEWAPIKLNPLKVANMAERANGEVQTTNTSYKDTYSYYIYNEELKGSFRVEMMAKANNDNWPCYGFTVEDESNNSVQFFAGGATTYRVMGNYNGLYKQSDKGATFLDGQCKMVLIYNEHTDRFYFYVNDVLFDSVKRSDYMSGTKFRYGIVGYMSGADGSPRPVTASDPYAVFTKPQLTQKFSVSLPKGATLTMDGRKINGNSVPVLSTVTVSIPVSRGRQYVIYLDGKPLETHQGNGRITATFTVTGQHKVTYAEAYITEWIHAKFDYDAASGGYCVLDHNVTAAGGYFADALVAEGANFMLETTMRGMDDSTWPSAGLIVGTNKNNYVRFSVIRNTDVHPNEYALRVGNANRKEIVKWFSGIETLKDNKPFGAGDNADMQFSVVRKDGYYYVYINGIMATAFDENELLSGEISIKDSLGRGNVKLGLFAEREITFTNWNYSTDISKYMGKMPNMEWIHTPFVYDSVTNSYRVTDQHSIANGGYIGGASYKQGTSFMLEETVRDMDTLLWPSTGLIVGTDKNHYVRFSVLRNTDVNPNVYALRAGNANGKEIVKWFSDIDTLKENKPFGANDKGNMELGLVYNSGYYYVYVNGILATTFGENELLSGEISIKDSLGTGNVKPGLFAERRITILNWNHSADISKYFGNMPDMEWIHSPFVYDSTANSFRVTDHNSVANGGYLGGVSYKQGTPFLLETTVRDMDTKTWPSTGLIVGTDKDHYVRFSVLRNTDANPDVYALRAGNANGKEIVKWFSDIDTLKENKPFGADDKGDMELGLVYEEGIYYVFVNGVLATTFGEDELLSGEISIKDSLGTGNVKLGLFAERKITFVNWNHSADVSKYLGSIPKMEWIHSPFVYDFVTGRYLVTDHNSVANGGYLDKSSVKKGESFLLEATVRDMDTETWPSTGLIIGADKDHYVRFSVIRNTDANPNVYALRIGNVNGKEFVKWFSDIDALKGNKPFGADDKGDMKLALVYHNGYYFVYVNDALVLTVDENMKLSDEISIKDSLGTGDVKLGLFAERKITFVNWNHSVEKADIAKYIGRKITVQEGMTVSVNGETRGDGTVYLRETVTVSMPINQGEELSFLVDGGAVETTIENGTASASFVVTGDHSVTVSRASVVSGKVSAAGLVDFTKVEVAFINENGQTVQTVIPDANGNFTANLARGTYYVSAKSDKLMSNVAKVAVESGVITGVDLNFSKPLLMVQTGVYTYDYKTGYYTTPASITDNRAYMGSAEQGVPFVLEAEIKDMTTADYPSVGFRIETGGENYLYFNLRYDTGAGVYQYWLKRWPWAEYGNIERLTTFAEGSWMRTTPFKDGTLKMALVYFDGNYYAYFNGELAFKISETEALNGGSIQDAIGDGTRRLNLFAEREVTFVDWNYSTDISAYADSLVNFKLASAIYKNQWGGDTKDFAFEPDKLLYRGAYGWYNTGVLETPVDVKAVDEWILEADVQIIADWQWPSVGFALYNGSDFSQNVKFEILRTTPEPYGDYSGHKWQLRVNGKDYWPGTENSTHEWLAANQEVLKGKVHLALVHINGEYKMYINGVYMCGITGEEAANITSGWGSIRPGFYAEQEATYENWKFSTEQTDLEAYR